MSRNYGFVLMVTGPLTLEQQLNLKSAGLPRSVFCSFLDGGFKFAAPSRTFTAHVPQIPAPPQLPTNIT